MPKWIVKAVAQGALSFVPGRESLKCYLQERVTGTVTLGQAEFESMLGLVEKHYCNYLRAGGRGIAFTALELGTGYYPVLPIGLWLCGARQVRTIDKLPLASQARMRKTLALFAKYASDGRLEQFLRHAREERIRELRELRTEAALPGVELLVGDARSTGLDASSTDFFFSNVVLRDIPEEILVGIFREFRRIATPGAIMSHHIPLEDHYADYDPGISVYNFLQYSDAAWKLVNCSLHDQDRLRIVDYRRIHGSGGFVVIAEENQTGSRERFEQLRLAQRFDHYHKEDLLVSRNWMVSTAGGQRSGMGIL